MRGLWPFRRLHTRLSISSFEEAQTAVDVVAGDKPSRDLLVQRMGLRLRQISSSPRAGEDHRTDYLRDGLHGLSAPAFLPDTG